MADHLSDGHGRRSTVQLDPGPTLAFVEYGDPGGEPLVFLHGIPDSSFSFSRLLPLIDGGRYHAFALDQRGHGDSERPECCYSMEDMAADVGRFLDAQGVERASVVGHSLGSAVARRFTEAAPDRVDRLILIGSSADFATDPVIEFRAEVQDVHDPIPESFVREFQLSTGYLPLPDDFFARVVLESLKVPARVLKAALQGMIDFDDRADRSSITAPTLLLWGERDPLFGRDQQERLLAAIPDARLIVYPETAHNPHWERPESVAYDLAAFLRETAPALRG